jgi:hypothetical protein
MPEAAKEEIVRVRVNLKLDPRINKRLEDVTAKLVPPQTKQRYIEDAIIRRLAEDWRRV